MKIFVMHLPDKSWIYIAKIQCWTEIQHTHTPGGRIDLKPYVKLNIIGMSNWRLETNICLKIVDLVNT